MLALGVACNNQISDAPHIEFTSTTAALDTIYEDSIVSISFQVSSTDAPLRKIQLIHAKSILFDTIVPHVDLFEYAHTTSFATFKGIQTVQIFAYDTDDLYASISKQYYVKELQSPLLFLDTTGVYRDTAIGVNEALDFDIRCIVGQRPLDSLIVYHNGVSQFKFPSQISHIFTDSVTSIPYSCNFSASGTYIVMLQLRDKASKFVSKQIKVTVTD